MGSKGLGLKMMLSLPQCDNPNLIHIKYTWVAKECFPDIDITSTEMCQRVALASRRISTRLTHWGVPTIEPLACIVCSLILREGEMFIDVFYMSLFDMGLWGILHGNSKGEYVWDLPWSIWWCAVCKNARKFSRRLGYCLNRCSKWIVINPFYCQEYCKCWN